MKKPFPHAQRGIALLLAIALCITLFPLQQANAAQTGMLRVLLSSMGTTNTIAIKLDGMYGIPSRPEIALTSGKSVVVSLSNGSLSINTGSQTINLGSSFTLKSYENTSGTNLMTLYNPKYGTVSYLGDMQFAVSGSSIRMISYLHLEDYLMGVVPYEMSNTFPLEALKAQSVAARTYAVAMMGGTTYDIVDTTADQVYKGYKSSDNIAHQAIKGTAGVVIMSNGTVASCFYSASNGGQTELPVNALSITSNHNVGCYAMVDDPYDLRNPESRVATVTFNVNGQFSNVGFESFIRDAVAYRLGVSAANISTMSVTSAYLADNRAYDPRSVGISRYYETLRMTVVSNMGTAELSLDLRDGVANAYASNLRLFELTNDGYNYTLTGRRFGHGVGLSQRGAEQMAKEGLDYHAILSFYYPGGQQTQLDLTRDAVEKRPGVTGGTPIGVGLVKLASTASTLTVRKTPSTSAAKVTSVKHGATLDVLGIDGDWLSVSTGNQVGYVMSKYVVVTMAPQNTPAPTPTNNEPAIAYGNITLKDDSAIRVRAQPSTDSYTEILGHIPKNDLVDILGASGEWYRIRYHNLVGYIMMQYITINPNHVPIPTPYVPTPVEPTLAPTMPPQTMQGVTKVDTAFYAGEGRYYSKLSDIPKGTTLEVSRHDQYWCYASYNGTTGYVITEDLTITEPTVAEPAPTASAPEPTATATATAKPVNLAATVKTKTKGSAVTLRSGPGTNYTSLGQVTDGTKITVTEKGSKFSKVTVNGKTGYISNDFIKY